MSLFSLCFYLRELARDHVAIRGRRDARVELLFALVPLELGQGVAAMDDAREALQRAGPDRTLLLIAEYGQVGRRI